MKTITHRHMIERTTMQRGRITEVVRRRQESRGSWVEALETRLVLSAPPVFGNIPAVTPLLCRWFTSCSETTGLRRW